MKKSTQIYLNNAFREAVQDAENVRNDPLLLKEYRKKIQEVKQNAVAHNKTFIESQRRTYRLLRNNYFL